MEREEEYVIKKFENKIKAERRKYMMYYTVYAPSYYMVSW
jgi:hypothetical protein